MDRPESIMENKTKFANFFTIQTDHQILVKKLDLL